MNGNLARVACNRGGVNPQTNARPLASTRFNISQWDSGSHTSGSDDIQGPMIPAYMNDWIQSHVPPRSLRSSDAPLLAVPLTQTKLACRVFSVAASSIWNSLPANIRLCHSLSTFKRRLKTHLFSSFYSTCAATSACVSSDSMALYKCFNIIISSLLVLLVVLLL